MDRNVSFILDASNQGWGEGRLLVPSTDIQGVRALIDRGSGLQIETSQSPLTVTLKLVIDGLISVTLSTVNLQVQFPLPRGEFSELWQLSQG